MRPLFLAALAAGVALSACGGSESPDAPAPAPPTASPAPSPAPPPSGLSATCDLPDFQTELMERINAARAQARTCGAATYGATLALAWHDRLYAAAAGHSTDMATNNFFSHTGSGGSTLGTRLAAAGYGFRSAGENIAFNYRSVADVMAGWLGSPGHCANIMDSRFREVGVACVRNSRGEPYWTMDLGARS